MKEEMDDVRERNLELVANFGLIGSGRLKDIEELQKFVLKLQKQRKFKVIFQTCTNSRLWLKKVKKEDGKESE